MVPLKPLLLLGFVPDVSLSWRLFFRLSISMPISLACMGNLSPSVH